MYLQRNIHFDNNNIIIIIVTTPLKIGPPPIIVHKTIVLELPVYNSIVLQANNYNISKLIKVKYSIDIFGVFLFKINIKYFFFK